MSTNPYPIYVINLKRTPERKLHMQRQLDALGLDYQFVDAVDKYDLQDPKYRVEIARLLGVDESIIERKFTSYFCDHLACALSHVKVYNLIVENNDSVACVLEDDIVISPDFSRILHASFQTPWDVLMLSSHSRTIRYIPATNFNIQKSMKEFPDIDCSLFSKLRKIRGFRRLLPFIPASQSQLDWRLIPKFEWCLLMLLSHSRVCNNLFKYFINAYKYLLQFTNPRHAMLNIDKAVKENSYFACKIGALPIRPSQQTLYGNYDIAIPAECPTSGMAYLLTSAMASQCKEVVNSKVRIPIDYIPWHLHEKEEIQLRIVTPPCVSSSWVYIINSAREQKELK